MISCGMDAYGKSVPSKQITPVRRHWQSTERQMMRMQHAYRVDEFAGVRAAISHLGRTWITS